MSDTLNYIGSRIRNYRMLAGLTQKELAQRCGLSEPAIRNYELGNRIPDEETLKTIALALEINYYALKQPDPFTTCGALNMLYLLESMYGLTPEVDGNDIRFVFKNRPPYAVPYITEEHIQELKDMIIHWNRVKQELIGKDFTEDTSHEDAINYMMWTSKYPMSKQEVEDFQKKHPEIYDDPDYEPLYRNLL